MTILIGIPSYDRRVSVELMSALFAAAARCADGNIATSASSVLTYGFNDLWCRALNDRTVETFVMVHADIVPHVENWLGRLLGEMRNYGADIMSVVAPLKNAEGLTSTALWDETRDLHEWRRLTMTEAMQLPETFDVKPVAQLFEWNGPLPVLLVNTGLMAVNMRRRDVLNTMCFSFADRIRRDEDGKFIAETETEDWNWSRQAHRNGLRVFATRAVPIWHVGSANYRNDCAWGTQTRDPDRKI